MDRTIDISEEMLYNLNIEALKLLLSDKTTKHNILWATKDYISYGTGFGERDEITLSNIVGMYRNIIRPRTLKDRVGQNNRTKEKAEVFTPSWICNEQNNLIDEQWFGRKDVFNCTLGDAWKSTSDKITFPSDSGKYWTDYVDARRLEISCGEAPYLASRYDAVTGIMIPVPERIGLLDRKFRIVNENTDDEDSWFLWAIRALQSVYGYEYQGDNLLLARENVLYTFVDNMEYRFGHAPSKEQMNKAANIIAWNLWQMDGITFTIPYGTIRKEHEQLNIFDFIDVEEEHDRLDEEIEMIAPYCKIKDWRANEPIEYRSLMKEEK